MAPITKKSTAGSVAKAGTGVFGKASSSIGKNSSMGSAGKSTNILGSSSKSSKFSSSSGGSYSSKSSSSFMASSGKNDFLLGTSGKNTKIMSANTKPAMLESSGKNSSTYGSSGKTGSFFGYTAKSENVLGSSGKTKVPSPPDKSSFLTPKSSNILGSAEKNKSSALGGKMSPDPNREYPSFINPQNNKPQTRIGIIWIPTRKRNKKKDMVYNPHNYDRYQEKSPSMYSYMSGDSPSYQQPHKKKEEETDLLVAERPKVTTVAVNTGITAATIDLSTENKEPSNPDEKQEFINHNSDDDKEGAGDTNERTNKNNSDYYDNKDNNAKTQDDKWDKDKQGDNVDSVYLRPPPAHKARSAASTNDDEDCGIKCLYYTLQCCDCVLM